MAPHASEMQQDADHPEGPPPPYSTQDRDDVFDTDKPDWEDGIFKLTIGFLPDPMIKPLEHARWAAELQLQTKDLPRLMREGLYWSEANVQEEKGRFLYAGNLPDNWNESDFTVVRIYHLIDVPRDEGDVRWTADLFVYARELSLLSNFRPGHLSIANIRIVSGRNLAGARIYWYDALCPGNSFNAIYDNRLLEGWWPWPKKRQVTSRGWWPWAWAKNQQG